MIKHTTNLHIIKMEIRQEESKMENWIRLNALIYGARCSLVPHIEFLYSCTHDQTTEKRLTTFHNDFLSHVTTIIKPITF